MAVVHFDSEVVLTNGKIQLRDVKPEDAKAIHALCSEDADIMRWVMRPDPFTVRAADEWIIERIRSKADREQITLSIEMGQDDGFALVGIIYAGRFDWIAKRGEIAYWIGRPFRGRRVASEAVQLLTTWMFEKLELVRLEILSPDVNTPSQKVALRAGYEFEGVLRSYRSIQGRPCDLRMYSALNPKYVARISYRCGR